jgi:prepilin-type N-terminal cleavage/methylation domain-containing protein
MYHPTNKKRVVSKKKAHQQGFSIIELTVVLAVAGMLIVGALVAGNTVMSNMKSNRYVQDISLIVTAARAWKGMGTSYTNLSVAELTGMERLPTAWGNGENQNPDGGNYVLTPGTEAEVGQFTITTTGADQPTCLNVLAQIQSQSVGDSTCSTGDLSAVFK